MPEQKLPDMLAKLVTQMRNTSDPPTSKAQPPAPTHFVFQVGQGGVVQFVFGKGVLNSTPEGGLEDN